VVNKLARGDFAVVKQKDRLYYRDVYDHYVRLHDISESMRDLLAGTPVFMFFWLRKKKWLQ